MKEKLNVPGFSIFGRRLVPVVALCQVLPLRCFVFESTEERKNIGIS